MLNAPRRLSRYLSFFVGYTRVWNNSKLCAVNSNSTLDGNAIAAFDSSYEAWNKCQSAANKLAHI